MNKSDKPEKRGRPIQPQLLDLKSTVDRYRESGRPLYLAQIADDLKIRPQQIGAWYNGKYTITTKWQKKLIKYFERKNIPVKYFSIDNEKGKSNI